jgi:WD40 repeat protein
VYQAHFNWISSLDFSPDGAVLATGSGGKTTKLWNTVTKTWQVEIQSVVVAKFQTVFGIRRLVPLEL